MFTYVSIPVSLVWTSLAQNIFAEQKDDQPLTKKNPTSEQGKAIKKEATKHSPIFSATNMKLSHSNTSS
jgi:hypothetical protein